MTKIMIGYGTTEGQTARIAEYIADVIRGQSHQARVVDLKQPRGLSPDDYDALIIGAPFIWASMRNTL